MNLFFTPLRSKTPAHKILISIICIIALAFSLMNAEAQAIEVTPEGKCREYQIYVLEIMENHNYEDGINKGHEILKEVEKLEGGKGMNYSKVLSELSILYDRVGKYDKAIEYANEVVAIQGKLLPDTASYYTSSRDRAARFYLHASQLNQAAKIMEENLEILKKKGSDKTLEYSIQLGNLAIVYSDMHNLPKSIDAHTEALSIIEQTQGKNSKDYARRLAMLAVPLFKSGEVKKSIEYTKQALAILERETGKSNEEYMTILNNLSMMQLEAGEHVEALLSMGEAKEICENLFGRNTKDYASRLSNYASIQIDLGKYRDALSSLGEALEIRRKLFPDGHTDVAITLCNLASCYRNIGETTEALKLETEALDIIASTLGTKSALYASILKNMSTTYYNLGNYPQAHNVLSQAADIIAEKYGTNSQDYASFLVNQAAMEGKSGNYSKALELDDKAIDIFKNTIGTNNLKYASLIDNKAIYLIENNQIEEAISLAQENLSHKESIFGKMHPQYAVTLKHLSSFYAHNKQYKEALKYSRNALYLIENGFGKKNDKYISTLASQCALLLTDNDIVNASMNAIKCNELISNHVKHLFLDLTSHERSMFWKKYNTWYSNVFPQIAYYSKNKSTVQAAYDAILFSKSLLLNTDIQLIDLISEMGSRDDIDLYKSVVDARRQLSKVYELPLESQKNMTDSLEKYIHESEKILLSRCKVFGDYTKKLSVTWQDVKQALGPDDIAIEFATFHNVDKTLGPDTLRYVAFTMKKDYDAPIIVPIASGPYGKKLFKSNRNDNFLNDSSIWAPLADQLATVKNIYFAPCEELYRIPIEYMKYPNEESKSMADVFNIRRLSSTREIALRNKQNGHKIGTASLFGGLTYGSSQDADSVADRSMAFLSDSISNLRAMFKPLLETKTEVENISKYLGKMKIKYQIFTDSIGTEKSFRELSNKNIGLLHVATHGFYWTKEDAELCNFQGFLNPNRFANYSEEDKALARSGLLLAGAETAFNSLSDNFDPDDGILTAKEIAQLNFRNLDMAVLSACQTGLGDVTSDGVFGLQRGFKKAGAQSLLVTLWKVDDKATQLFMTHFYEALSKGKSKVESLRLAQSYIKEYEPEPNFKPYANPQFWAAFILIDAI